MSDDRKTAYLGLEAYYPVHMLAGIVAMDEKERQLEHRIPFVAPLLRIQAVA